jgi:colanic acid biosynthesis glycosyl transferase WcaI
LKIIFVNRFFFPDNSASSQILGDLVFSLAGNGHAISILPSRLHYDIPGPALPAH